MRSEEFPLDYYRSPCEQETPIMEYTAVPTRKKPALIVFLILPGIGKCSILCYDE